jgi:hypothetical protein
VTIKPVTHDGGPLNRSFKQKTNPNVHITYLKCKERYMLERKRNPESGWEWRLTQIMFNVLDKYGEGGFTADEIYEEANTTDLAPTYLSRHVGAFLKSFKASGRIRKTGEYRLSRRNGSSPLPVYVRR